MGQKFPPTQYQAGSAHQAFSRSMYHEGRGTVSWSIGAAHYQMRGEILPILNP